jgi:threonine dehydrogenase-like Zn-dependent dehydrogenase
MQGIYFDGSKAQYRDNLPKPEPAEGESLVKILMAAVCNTDKEILKGYRPDFNGVMGHEFVGIVENSTDKNLVGKRVVGELNATCGKCIYCRTGRLTHCSSRRVLGMHDKDGCFGEYMTIDTSLLHVVPDVLKTDKAIYTEPLAAAFEILTQIDVTDDKNVAILGDGRLAYCVAQAFHSIGKEVTVIGKHPEKLKLFTDSVKLSSADKNIPINTSTEWEKEGYEIVVEATGSPLGIRQALDMVRKKGTIVLKSTYAGETTLPMSLIAVNEITIVGSRCGPFVPALDALASGKAVFPDIRLYSLTEYEKAFEDKGFKAGFRM